jgi:hypothetical protein
MNNADVEILLTKCEIELKHIESIIEVHGGTSLIVPYLNKYSVIKSCGTIETSFKALIADYCNKKSKPQVKNFINKRIRYNSANPSYNNIKETLKSFDVNWASDFKNQMQNLANYNSIIRSIESLVNARNEFAHGGNPTITFTDIKNYFNESKEIILIIDNVIG